MDDCCAVCAEPLEWTAYGPCGHKDACSKCVTRLRFALGDTRCVICQQQSPTVIATRFMGTFTDTLPAEEFSQLKAKCREGLYIYLAAATAYFDDRAHFNTIKALCSYTHPVLDGEARQFHSIKDLRRHLATTRDLHFCDVCLDARKVFVSEQLLYSRAELERHKRTGDTEGPLAESGFRGHAHCRFCRRYYFGDNELFAHMQTGHEQCFLCRRARPDKFVYYRDYAELEDHYRHEHWMCGTPECKGVVFAAEHELRAHAAREHGDAMSRAERRQAMTIPITLQYRRDEDSAAGVHAGLGAAGPSGVSIDAPVHRRGRGGAGRSGAGRGAPEPNQAPLPPEAVRASLESAAVEAHRRGGPSGGAGGAGGLAPGREGIRHIAGEPAFSSEDFPAAAGGPGGSAAAAARWAAAAGGGVGGAIRPEDFPALPGTSKAAKKRAKERRTLAERLAPGTSAATGAATPPAPAAGAPAASAGAGASGDVERPASGGVSESARAANKALMDKVRARVGEAGEASLRCEAARYVHGESSASAYHAHAVLLGLASLVPEMAALLPNAGRREGLLEEHRRHFAAAEPAGGGRWVPPEAAEAAAAHAAANASWRCSACTLVNGPGEEGPGAGGSGAGAERGKKVRKVPKFERLRLTGGDPEATRTWLDTDGGTRVHPQNVWTQARPSSLTAAAPPGGLRGQWSKPGRLATELVAVKGAWDKQ
ncbi:hypothetical protein WJX81_002678 [Elliptochloris bilobata]|uniref:RING-type domain-containing protein n=1 Tax=Elliptochloris bilobata TaxID=381761 RepID=A0AAW1RLB5_9CHLO